MLIGRHGNTLEALNLVVNNALNAGVRNNRRYYTVDAEGIARAAPSSSSPLALATRDRRSRSSPQRLEPMLPSERKIVHLALAEFRIGSDRVRRRRTRTPGRRLPRFHVILSGASLRDAKSKDA